MMEFAYRALRPTVYTPFNEQSDVQGEYKVCAVVLDCLTLKDVFPKRRKNVQFYAA